MKKVDSVSDYFSGVHCLVVEPSASFLNNIITCLTVLGAPKGQIHYALRFEDAAEIVDKVQPRFIITEYQIGDKFGLSLIEKLDALIGENNRIAILATKNSSDTAVAEAAEEQIDSYILKPFSMGEFKKKIEETIRKKMEPTPYAEKIKQARDLYLRKEFDKALLEFEEAKRLGDKPSLAHYYCGAVHHERKHLDKAIVEFKAGLLITPLHYKCLTGKFDVLFELQNYKEAYSVVPVLRSKYPVSPQRLGWIMICAVYSGHFEDLPEFYKLFTSLPNRPPELVKIITAALKAAAKLMIKSMDLQKAYDYFEMGIAASGLNPDFIADCCREMLRANGAKFASELFKKYPRHLVTTDQAYILNFMIESQNQNPADALEMGKKVMGNIAKGDPEFYRQLVKTAIAAGKKMAAEDIVNKAVVGFPDMRKELYDLLDA